MLGSPDRALQLTRAEQVAGLNVCSVGSLYDAMWTGDCFATSCALRPDTETNIRTCMKQRLRASLYVSHLQPIPPRGNCRASNTLPKTSHVRDASLILSQR